MITEQKEKMKAVVYARYSSHGQTEQSIEGQLHDAYQFADREGYTIIKEYVDRAKTGKYDNRESFQKMIQDSAKKQFQYVLVWKLDRFARNRYDSAIYKAKLKKNGVKVISIMENIGDTPEGIILEGMLESMAEYYSANLSENVRRGIRESISKGKYIGGNVPYGYLYSEGHLIQDPVKAPIIRYVFEQYAAGIPKSEIIAELNRRGVRGKKGGPCTQSTFQENLKNTVYYGHLVRSGTVVEGCVHEPIISKELFDAVQEKLAVYHHTGASQKAPVPYLLRGKIFCGHCGSSMVGESGKSKTGVIHNYYACAKRKKYHTCKKKNEKRDEIEDWVVDRAVKYILSGENIGKIAELVVKEYEKEFSESTVSDLQKTKDKLSHDLDQLVDALTDAPAVARKKIYEKMETIGAQLQDLEDDIAKQMIAQRITYTRTEVIAWMKTFCSGDLSDQDFRQRIIDTFVKQIYVYDDYFILLFNLSSADKTKIEFSDVQQSFPEVYSGSDITGNAPHFLLKSERAFVFIKHKICLMFKKPDR